MLVHYGATNNLEKVGIELAGQSPGQECLASAKTQEGHIHQLSDLLPKSSYTRVVIISCVFDVFVTSSDHGIIPET